MEVTKEGHMVSSLVAREFLIKHFRYNIKVS